MILIGISGKAGSGKDTAKEMIVAELVSRGMTPTTLSFAGPLKDALVLWFGWDRQRLDSDFPYKEGGLGNAPGLPDDIDPICVMLDMTRREIMQKFGTECMRDGMDQNFWIKLAELRIKTGRYKGDAFIISDARFTNELDWVRANGGYTLLIDRLVVEPGEDAATKLDAFLNGTASGGTLTDKTGHASEMEFETWPHFTQNITNVVNKNIEPEASKATFRETIATTVIPEMVETLGLDHG